MSRGRGDEDKHDRRVQELVRALGSFEFEVRTYAEEGVQITGFSVRLPKAEGLDFFMVVRAETEGSKIVAFRDGEDLAGLLRGLLRALKARNLKWRQDNYE